MKSEYPYSPFVSNRGHRTEDLPTPPSRLLDEKISDDSGTEANSDSALQPPGLKNPFWKSVQSA